jgi:hypothetical protein
MSKVAKKYANVLRWSHMLTKKRVKILLAVLIFLVALGGAGFFYYQYKQAQSELLGIKLGMTDSEREVKVLVAEVGKLIYLPNDEDPQVRVVSDVEKLKDQEFFKNAKNGDKVLIYVKAKKAILYDPISKIIIDVAPVNTSTSSAEEEVVSPVLTEVKVVIRNGTEVTGLASRMSSHIVNILPEANIMKRENASRFDYSKTLVVILNDVAKTYGEKLATSFNASVALLPSGEKTEEGADLLVILGLDKTQ